jgi:GDP-mannose 6-dehydrogenase
LKICKSELDAGNGDMLATLYQKLKAPLIRTDLETVEMVKYVDNSWHALKIGFVNEIGTLCKSLGLDAHKVMKTFCQDRKLNISYVLRLAGLYQRLLNDASFV